MFEVLVADILKDLGFDTELTSLTRDGGRDIYAYVRTAVTSFLMFVECKRWSSQRKVGIEVVQRIYGAAKASGADKSMIVTTSFFTKSARVEQKRSLLSSYSPITAQSRPGFQTTGTMRLELTRPCSRRVSLAADGDNVTGTERKFIKVQEQWLTTSISKF